MTRRNLDSRTEKNEKKKKKKEMKMYESEK